MQIGTKDLDQINPDWRFAYFHAKSTKPGNCSQQTPQLCQCCLNIIHKQPIPLNVHAKDLQFLGFGFPLWFSFLKNCAVLVLVLIVSQSIVSVYNAVKYNRQECSQQYKELFSKTVQPSKSRHPHLTRRYYQHDTYLTNQEGHMENNINTRQIWLQSSDYAHLSNQQNLNEETEQENSGVHSPEAGNHGKQPEAKQQSKHGVHGNHRCTGVFILLSRRQDKISGLEQILRVSSFFITMFTLLFIRDTIYKTQQYYDQRRCSLGDYSVIFSKLPKNLGIQSSIRRFLYQGLSLKFKIQQMILIPQLDQLQVIQQQQSHHMKQLQKIYQKGNEHKIQTQQQIKRIKGIIEVLEQKQKQEIIIFKNQLKTDKLCSERVIIVLNSQPQKERLLEEFEDLDKNTLKQYFGDQGTQIQIQQAPQPRQIIWENVNYPTSQRFGRIVMGWTLSAIFIGIITVIFYFVLKLKSEFVQHKQGMKRASFIVYTSLILVILFNKFVMGTVLHYFTDLQKHATSDKFQFSFAFKYALGMFFTTALMTLFVEAFSFQNFDKHPYGVIEQQSIMFLMNSLLVPVIWIINPFQIMVLIKRKLNFGKKHLTQRQANHLMQDFSYDIGKRYAQILEIIWFTFLYISLIPIGSFLTLIGLGLYYWVDKYNLLRRSSIHQNVSGKLSIIALKLLDLILILMPLGWIIFDYYLKKQHHVSILSVIFLLIGIIYLCLPLNDIIDFINKQNFMLEQKHYQDVKNSFKDNYFNLHPLYSKTHEEEITHSRKVFKQEVLKQFANPIFSFAQGWLAKGAAQKNVNLSSPKNSGPHDQISNFTGFKSPKNTQTIKSTL